MNAAKLIFSLLSAGILVGGTSLALGQEAPASGDRASVNSTCKGSPQAGARGGQESRQKRRKGRCGGQGTETKEAEQTQEGARGQCGQGQGRGQGQGLGKGKGQFQGQCRAKGQGQGRRKGAQVAPQELVQVANSRSTKAYVNRLQAILQEEFYAHDFYTAASATNPARRYANLARAESRHADAIASMIRKLGAEPVLEHSRRVGDDSGQTPADSICREIELMVIDVYDGLIKDCPDASLLPVLRNIQAANRRHLAAVGD